MVRFIYMLSQKYAIAYVGILEGTEKKVEFEHIGIWNVEEWNKRFNTYLLRRENVLELLFISESVQGDIYAYQRHRLHQRML